MATSRSVEAVEWAVELLRPFEEADGQSRVSVVSEGVSPVDGLRPYVRTARVVACRFASREPAAAAITTALCEA